MRRGDLVLVDFDPVRGSEVSKQRPAVIVSNDGANRRAAQLGRLTVPLLAELDRALRLHLSL